MPFGALWCIHIPLHSRVLKRLGRLCGAAEGHHRLCYTGPAYGTTAQLLLEGMRRSISKDYAHVISSKRMELVTLLWEDGFESFWELAKRRRFGFCA